MPGMLTSPLDLRRHLREPDKRFSLVPFVDILIVAVLIGLSSSQFVFAPGVNIALPKSDSSVVTNVPTSTVLTIKREDMILFQDGPYSYETLKSSLPQYVKANKLEGSVLLVKTGSGVSSQRLLDIVALANEAGFGSVQLATDSIRESDSAFSETGF